MSFLDYKMHIDEGDTIMICRGRENISPLIVKKGAMLQVKGGAISHDTFIGKEFGSKIYTSNGNGWVIALHPTPELWTISLPHRTQILYTTDISLITMQLELRPGSVVCEAGTGSGSLSHAIARTIAPAGHLYTFEFHEQRAAIAKDEFESHRMSDIVSIECRDVCKDGFGMKDRADAVFLDLPSPWEMVHFAKEVIKTTGGRLCSFSPCIEQVQRTCQELRNAKFDDVEVMECLLRPFDVRPCVINIANLGGEGENQRTAPPIESTVSMYTCAPHRDIPGHTGYLTFATLHHK